MATPSDSSAASSSSAESGKRAVASKAAAAANYYMVTPPSPSEEGDLDLKPVVVARVRPMSKEEVLAGAESVVRVAPETGLVEIAACKGTGDAQGSKVLAVRCTHALDESVGNEDTYLKFRHMVDALLDRCSALFSLRFDIHVIYTSHPHPHTKSRTHLHINTQSPAHLHINTHDPTYITTTTYIFAHAQTDTINHKNTHSHARSDAVARPPPPPKYTHSHTHTHRGNNTHSLTQSNLNKT
jgi:hypothetical protein